AGLTHLLFCTTIVIGIVVTLQNLFTGHATLPFAALTFLPFLLAAIRGVVRVTAAQEVLPSLKSQVQQQAWIHLLLGACIPFLYCVNFIASAFTRTIRWRGIRYELISPQQTKIVTR